MQKKEIVGIKIKKKTSLKHFHFKSRNLFPLLKYYLHGRTHNICLWISAQNPA